MPDEGQTRTDEIDIKTGEPIVDEQPENKKKEIFEIFQIT